MAESATPVGYVKFNGRVRFTSSIKRPGNRNDWIPIQSLTWDDGETIHGKPGSVATTASVIKEVDSTSPGLRLARERSEIFDYIYVELVTVDPKTRQEKVYYSAVLKDAVISNVQYTDGSHESVSFTAAAVKFSDGKPRQTASFGTGYGRPGNML